MADLRWDRPIVIINFCSYYRTHRRRQWCKQDRKCQDQDQYNLIKHQEQGIEAVDQDSEPQDQDSKYTMDRATISREWTVVSK